GPPHTAAPYTSRWTDRHSADVAWHTAQPLHLAPVALGGAARPAVAQPDRHGVLARRRRRAVVDEALRGHRRPDPLAHDARDHHDPVAPRMAQPHLVTGPHRLRGFDALSVDPDVPRAAGRGRHGARLGQPHGPDPAVHPYGPLV